MHHAGSHVFDRIVVGNHDNGIAVFFIDGFDQLQDLLGCLIVQRTCRLIAQQDVRILDDGPSNRSSLLLTSG